MSIGLECRESVSEDPAACWKVTARAVILMTGIIALIALFQNPPVVMNPEELSPGTEEMTVPD